MPSTTLIMPCAGRSSRFDVSKPKWMLTHPNGNLMMMESLYGLELKNVSRILITVVKDHIEQHKVNLKQLKLNIQFKTGIDTEFIILNTFTYSQSDTVLQTLLNADISGPIFIKDCDNYFNTSVGVQNSVCVSTLQADTNAINKSYISTNKYGFLSGIIEKQVISNTFCVGGYSFNDSLLFKKVINEIEEMTNINKNELYISHIIQKLLLDGEIFETQSVANYSDWGTLQDWQKYISQFKTIFIDLDGTLVQNSSEYFEPIWGQSIGLINNIKTINALHATGKVKIIITTSRPKDPKTLQELKLLNIQYDHIIFDLPHSQRIIINDYSATNPYPSALAICLKRDDDNLGDLL